MAGAPRSGTSSAEEAERGGPVGPAARHRRWTYLASHTLPWFGLGALVVIVGSFAFHDPTESYMVVAGMVVLVAACIRYTVRDDPLRSLMVARRGLAGWMATETAGGRRRRARQRAAAARHEDAELHYDAPPTWK